VDPEQIVGENRGVTMQPVVESGFVSASLDSQVRKNMAETFGNGF